jgi:hypothetical protein
MDTGELRLVVFCFILSILFPMFAYTFTTFAEQPSNFDITLDVEELSNAGIMLSDGESHNVTFGGVAQEYEVKNQTMRIQWLNRIFPLSDFVAHQKQSWIELQFDTWIYPILMNPIMDMSQGFIDDRGMDNITIINYFDPVYNWTMYDLVQNGQTVFITTLKSDNNNITKAVLETGTLTFTVGSKMFEDETNFVAFVDWYRSIVTGASNWGLPDFMIWVTRIFSFLMLLSGVLLAKEFVPFV